MEIEESEYEALRLDATRYRWLRGVMWWRTDPFAQDVGNMRTGYWQTKLFKRVEGTPANLDAAIDAAIDAATAAIAGGKEGR